jgi:hypothetical protein
MLAPMSDLILGKSYSFAQIMSAYRADPPTGGAGDQFFVLHRGDEIVALCLRYKFNPKPGEAWVGTVPAVAIWGERLAQCKDKQTVPLYYCPRHRSFYEFLGPHLVTGDTVDPQELAARKGAGPLSRVVFLSKVSLPAATPPR